MKLIQKVVIMQVLTEQSKLELLTYYKEQKRLLETESEQLLFEQKKVEHKNRYQPERVNEYFEHELNLRQEKIKLVEFQMEQLETLPLGSEIRERELETIVDVQVGDEWSDATLSKTIVVTDGVITEIR
ncbi:MULTISPECIES: YlqD family protein [Listeria]|uniref:YlqD family protein n=1 Tax=Listeria TaxID=1637 RepID=UPI000B596321|nr:MULTISPECIES: YlqD family protein [Listeria]